MAQVQLRGTRVAVEKLKKQSNKNNTIFMDVETEEFVGIVRFVGAGLTSSDLQIGQKVYFGNTYQQVRMASMNLCVMDAENVLAIVNENTDGQAT